MPPQKASQCRTVESDLEKRTGICRVEQVLRPRLQEKELSQREQVLFSLEYIHDGIVQLSEHHKVDRKAGSAVLGGGIAREPGQGIVLLQHKP